MTNKSNGFFQNPALAPTFTTIPVRGPGPAWYGPVRRTPFRVTPCG
ncbi:hypothetical protein OG410_26795 [Streptomyces sp. NBC_00659]|nr:hypothetical protein [Streptomyces sp. NBC_00659]